MAAALLALGGCTSFSHTATDGSRIDFLRMLSDTGAEEIEVTIGDMTVRLKGYQSDQSKALDVAKAALEAAR
jgi:hypothetical protein